MLIQDPQSMCLDNVYDLYRKVKPFIYYWFSEHRKMEPEGSSYIASVFDIGIFIRDDEEHYKRLVEVHADTIGDVFEFRGPRYLEFGPYTSYTKPFEIHIGGITDYMIQEEENEEEERKRQMSN